MKNEQELIATVARAIRISRPSGNGGPAIAAARLGQWERLRDNVARALNESLATFDAERFKTACDDCPECAASPTGICHGHRNG